MSGEDIPRHVGIIPDGIRRWARKNEHDLQGAYLDAMGILARLISHLFDWGVMSISVYLLSKENLSRPRNELLAAVEAELSLITHQLPILARNYQVQVLLAGNLELADKRYEEVLKAVPKIEPKENVRKLFLLIAYNPIDELLSNIFYLGLDGKDILNHLWVNQKVDLVVRTGGEQRLSNFLPIQSGYAELIFQEKFFNELTIEDFEEFKEEYLDRQRRFGK